MSSCRQLSFSFESLQTSGMVLELPFKDPTFDLVKSVCSHGLFMMAPNQWDPITKSLTRPLRLSPSKIIMVNISQPISAQSHILISLLNNIHPLSYDDQQTIKEQVKRMLRISEKNDGIIREFHEIHAESKERGFGRVFRSPTLFEDMVKCILLCNCQWSRTLSMAKALCALQLELYSHSATADFQPKTPQKNERKRKREIIRKNTVVNLKTKFVNTESKTSQDRNSVINNDNQHSHLSAGDPNNISTTSQRLNIKSSDVGDFPNPDELANLESKFLAERCKLGYRAQRIISLAKSIVDGKIQLKNLEQLCDGSSESSYKEIDTQLSGISGFGPFTRANVLMCMGFYNRIPVDTETIRHLKMVHARKCTMQTVQKNVEAIYGKYGQFQFLAYWSELWDYYERRFGDLSEMLASDYQLITASNMKNNAQDNVNFKNCSRMTRR